MRIPRTASAWVCATMVFALGAHGAPAAQAAQGNAHGAGASGIWKAAVPPQPMSGEFDGFDPIGVASGAKIKADCSINWIDPDDGKRYCFSSGTSLEFFLDQPHASIERARMSWEKMTRR
jgi:hypothetical protein